MNAFPLKVWIARCDDCDWEDDELYDTEWDAERACERHDEEEHSNDEPTETYQERLDRLTEAAVANARA